MAVKMTRPRNPATQNAVFLRLPDELRDAITTLAHREDRTLSSMMRILINEALNARREKP